MAETTGKHAQKHAQSKSAELDARAVKLHYSPEVVRGFARIEAAVHDSKHFSPEILENLRDYAAGKPEQVEGAVAGLALVAREVMKHVQATGDGRAKEAFEGLAYSLMGIDAQTPPVTLTNPLARRRESGAY